MAKVACELCNKLSDSCVCMKCYEEIMDEKEDALKELDDAEERIVGLGANVRELEDKVRELE